MKATPWFDVTQRPVRTGVYERNHGDGGRPLFQHWNGKFWGYYCRHPEDAALVGHRRSSAQKGMWRGLAKKP